MASTKLGTGDFGEDVARLHEALAQHGIEISPEERKRKFFGPATRAALGKFQAAHGMDRTYEVCESTAAKLAFAAKPLSPEHSQVERGSTSQNKTPPLESKAPAGGGPTPVATGFGGDEAQAATAEFTRFNAAGTAPTDSQSQRMRPAPARLVMDKLLPLLKTSPSLQNDASLDKFARLFVERAAIAPDA